MLVADGITGLDYSDGAAVEDLLLRQVSATRDLSVLSPELRALITDWPTRYHFSSSRANLLRPLQFRRGARILEVGAGCGALTRYLGESGLDVVAVEGSAKRAQIAAQRTHDLPTVQVVHGRLDEIEFDERFDAVILVGILEYAAMYEHADADPHLALLRRCGELLTADGVLLLAIENRIGLKYLAGAAEDHTGRPYEGIDNGYAPHGPRTFTKSELTHLLDEAGLPVTEFLALAPDYKMARSVIRFSKAPEESILSLSHVIAASFRYDSQHQDTPPFSLEQVGAAIVANGDFEKLANSFLVLAAPRDDNPAVVLNDHEFAWSFAVERDPRFAKETVLCRPGVGLSVVHHRLGSDADELSMLSQRLDPEPHQPGRSAWLRFVGSVNRSGWSVSDAAAALRGWYEYLVEQSDRDLGSVSGDHVDLTPFNVMDDHGQIKPFDQEWIWAEAIPTDWVAARGILFSINMVTSVAMPSEGVPIHVGHLVNAILDDLAGRNRRGPEPPIGFMEWLASVQALMSGQEVAQAREELEDLWRRQISIRSAKTARIWAAEAECLNAALASAQEAATAEAERQDAALAANEQKLRLSEETLRGREQALRATEQTLTEVLTSKSWGITAPLRALTRMLRRRAR